MGSDTQAFLDDFPTPVALLRREAGRNVHDLMTSSCSLIFKELDEGSPRGVGNALGQRMILEHAVDVQVLHTAMGIVLCIRLGRLEEKGPPVPLDFEMRLGTIARRFPAPVTPLFAATEVALLAAQGALALAIRARVGDKLPSGIRKASLSSRHPGRCSDGYRAGLPHGAVLLRLVHRPGGRTSAHRHARPNGKSEGYPRWVGAP
jgi:hypothetical protein